MKLKLWMRIVGQWLFDAVRYLALLAVAVITVALTCNYMLENCDYLHSPRPVPANLMQAWLFVLAGMSMCIYLHKKSIPYEHLFAIALVSMVQYLTLEQTGFNRFYLAAGLMLVVLSGIAMLNHEAISHYIARRSPQPEAASTDEKQGSDEPF